MTDEKMVVGNYHTCVEIIILFLNNISVVIWIRVLLSRARGKNKSVVKMKKEGKWQP